MKKSKILFRSIFLTVSVIVFLSVMFGCNHQNGDKNKGGKDDGGEQTVTITVDGDANVKSGKGTSFGVGKGTKWSSVKEKSEITGVVFEDGFELLQWNLNGESGDVLTDDYAFDADATVFASSKPKTSTEQVTITIDGDKNVKSGKGSFKVNKDISWAVLRLHEKIKSVTFEDGFELWHWKFNGELGEKVTNDFRFEEDTVIFAKTHKKANQTSEGISIFLNPDKLKIKLTVKTADSSNITLEGCQEVSITSGQTTEINANSANEAIVLKGNITYLALSQGDILSINLKGCENIETINLMGNMLTNFDASGLSKLKTLLISKNELLNLNLEGCTLLNLLMCQNNQLSSLDVHGLTSLKMLLTGGNILASLNAKGCTALTKLDCGNNQISKIDLEGCNELTELTCFNNQLSSLDVKFLSKLQKLNCSANKLNELDVSGMKELKELICKEGQLTSLNLSGCVALEGLWCYNNQLSEINLQGLDSLVKVYCRDNKLTKLDISNLPKLAQIWISGNKIKEEAFTKIFKDLPSTGGVAILYTVKEGYTEENIKVFDNPQELKEAFLEAKNTKKWDMRRELTHDGKLESIE